MSRWNGKGHLKVIFLIVLVFLLGVTIGLGRSDKSSAPSNNVYEDLKVFTEVIGLLQKEYVEESRASARGGSTERAELKPRSF